MPDERIAKNADRKEESVGQMNFFRGSTKPQNCETSLGDHLGRVEIPLDPGDSFCRWGRWRVSDVTKTLRRSLVLSAKVFQPQAGSSLL